MNGFCHIEIPCTDFGKIGKFYTDVFGWKVTEAPEMFSAGKLPRLRK